MLAPLAVSLLAVLLGTAGVLPAAQDPPANASPPSVPAPAPPADPPRPSGRIVVHAVDAATDRPLVGAEVSYYEVIEGKLLERKVATDGAGAATAAYNPDGFTPPGGPTMFRPSIFRLTIRKAGYVPDRLVFDGRARTIVIPQAVHFRLQPGRTLGGVIRDEAGRPVAGATVELTLPATRPGVDSLTLSLGEPITDAAGRWEVREAPADTARVTFSIRHPGYLAASGTLPAGPDAVTATLARAATVAGIVTDADGKPVKGASVRLGRDRFGTRNPEATTDAAGKFALDGCPAGPSVVTVQADDFAPQAREILVERAGVTAPLLFRLEPGATLRVRVVDGQGRPVGGAFYAANSWRGLRTLDRSGRADADGRIEWRGAPAEAVEFNVRADGYRVRQVQLAASPEVQDVVVAPQLVVSGRVTDARTGAPVPRFTVTEGNSPAGWPGPHPAIWRSDRGGEDRDGQFRRVCEWGGQGDCYLRLEAPGYRTTQSRAFRPDESAVSWDVALEPEAWLAGVVVGPGGQPVAGADVALGARGPRRAQFTLHGAGLIAGATRRTGPDGRFEFPEPHQDSDLVAVSPVGFARVPVAAFRAAGTLALQPWGRVTGRVLVGGRPAAGEAVKVDFREPDRDGVPVHSGRGGEARTDADGRFAFDRVIPGPVQVARAEMFQQRDTSYVTVNLASVMAEVPAGGAVDVTLGLGRPVSGRIVLDGIPTDAVDWARNSPVRIRPEEAIRPGADPLRFPSFGATIDTDGRFRVDAVPPGRYRLDLTVIRPGEAFPKRTPASRIGEAQLDFAVPEGDAAGPVDLGDIPARPAPDRPARPRP